MMFRRAIEESKRVRWGIVGAIAFAFLGGASIGWIAALPAIRKNISEADCFRDPGYELVSPLVFCGLHATEAAVGFRPLADRMNDAIDAVQGQSELTDVSIYFRDLSSAQWIGINEEAEYDPASLFKVPIMIAYFRAAETEPGIMNDVLYYPANGESSGRLPFVTLPTGHYYSVNELMRAMIVNSDDEARDVLFAHINKTTLRSVFTDLDIPIPTDTDFDFKISPEAYSTFFRVLYNATYLTREDSEKAMKLLSETTYNDGIASGVPPGIAVAHKYGVYATPGAPIELHDCGVVYYPDRPYMLCVMTKGTDVQALAAFIANVSSVVFQEVRNDYQ